MKKVVVLGGGLAGLSHAAALRGKAHVTLLEKENRLGGVIRTIKKEGFLFEEGPHSIRAAPSMIAGLGLEKEILLAEKKAQKRYVYREGKLRSFPTPFAFPLALWRELFAPKGREEDESIASFVERRFGKSFLDHLVEPFVVGIYAGKCRDLSMRSSFPHFFAKERKSGSLLRSSLFEKRDKSVIFSFRNGMETLVQALAAQIQGEVRLNCKVTRIERGAVYAGKEVFEADEVISTLPAPALAKIVQQEVAERLAALPYQSLAIVGFGFHGPVLKHEGFGYLLPPTEKSAIFGGIFDSAVFPDQAPGKGSTRISFLMRPCKNMERQARQALVDHLAISEEPDVVHIYETEGGIPQFPLFFYRKQEEIVRRLSYITLSGSWISGVAIPRNLLCLKS